MEWSRLRVLDAVAHSGSVTRAAALLHMTGPAVSQQLRRIEAEAGAKVVEADGRGVRLTSHGALLADYARQVAELMQRAENDLHRDEPVVGHITVAAIASIIRTLLVDKLPAFQQTHPRIRVSLEDGETMDHLTWLAEGRCDLVLAESWSAAPLRLPPDLCPRRIFTETIWLALPPDHRLAGRERIDLQELDGERWATCARDSDAHQALTQIARRQGVEPDVGYHVADPFTQIALVQTGLAVACLPQSSAVRQAGVIYRPLLPEVRRDALLVTSDRTLPAATEALCAHLLA